MGEFTHISFLDQPLFRVFFDIKDPRVGGRCLHPLINIIFIALCALISGADGCQTIENFGKERKCWLSQFINLENGIPSHLTFMRAHWSVENNLHWKLDVGLHEDDCQIYRGFADQHLAALRKVVLALLKKEKSFKGGIELKRHKATLSARYLRKVLNL